MPKLINVPGVGRVPVPDDYTFDQIFDLREQLQKKAGLEPDIPQQFGLGELAGRAFERQYERAKIGFGDVIPAMFGSAFGYDEYAKRQMEEAAKSEQALQERIPEIYKTYQDVETGKDALGYAAEALGGGAFDVLTSLVPGGVGATLGRVGAQTAARQALAGAARQGLAREAAVKAAETAAERSATRGMLAGTYLGSYAQNAPEVFQGIYQETGKMEPAVAALYGGLSSALDSILPAKVLDQLGTVGKGALIREMVKESGADPKVWKTIGSGVAKGFLTEGVTETGQEFINNLAVKTLKENYDLFSPDNVTRYIDSFLRGAIVGGGVSLPSSTVEAVRERGLVKAREAEEAAKVAEQQRVEAENIAAQQKLEAQNQILSRIPEGIEPIRMGEDIFTVEQTGKAQDLIPAGYVVSGVQDRAVGTLAEANRLKDAMESTKDADIAKQEEERTKLIERLAKLDEELDRKQKDVINVSREDFEAFRDKTYPEQVDKLNEQIGIKDQILEALQKPIQIKPLEETKERGIDEFTAFKHTPEGRVPVSTGDTPDVARDLAFKQPEEVSANAPTVSANAPVVSAEPSAEPSADLLAQEEVTGEPVEELRKELDRLGLPDVGVKLYKTLLGQGTPVDGAFTNQTISIAMNPTRSRIQTLHHEAIHAFKEAGLFTESEWKALTTAAKKDWLKRKWPALQGKTVAELYSDMSPEIQIEEAIAVAFEHYMQKAFSPAGLVATAFNKLANFFGRIRNFFTGKGYQTADDVFDFVASGAMRYKIKPSEVSIGPTSINEEDPSFKFARRTKPAPKKTVTAYKLFKVKKNRPGELFPLFVNSNTPVPVGEWMDADIGESAKATKTGRPQVKSKLGPLAMRPGWHAGDLPIATHIGGEPALRYDEESGEEKKLPTIRRPDEVWVEVEMADDKDWQTEANRRATAYKTSNPQTGAVKGQMNPSTAEIKDQIPEDGYYRYKTNPNMTGNWLIGGSMKINRILSSEEVEKINNAAGVKDLPRKEPFNPAEYGFGRVKFARAPSVESEEFKRWFGDSKVVGPEGKPLVLYRGIQGDAEGALNAEPRGEYNVFASDSPDVAASYGMPDETFGTPGSILPIYVKADKLTEFPVTVDRYGSRRFDKIEFDRRARLLAPGEVLVARQVVDIGPMAREAYAVDKEKKYSYYSDVYALGRGTSVKSAIGNRGTFDPSKKDIRFARNVIDISNQLEDKEDRELERYATEGGVYSAMQMLTPQVRADIRKTLALADTALKDDGTIFFDQDREFADRFINNVTYVYDGLGRGDLDYAEIRTPALIKEAKDLAKDLQTRIEEHTQYKQKGLKLVKFARSPLEGSEKFKQWFKDSKITEDGRPKVMYHGTSRDIESFRPKQANAIFVTDSPKFAEAFSLDSYAWLARHVDEWATPEIKSQVEKKAQALIRQDYKGRARAEILAELKNRQGEGLDYLTRAYQELVPVGPNLIPVYVSAQNPFDYENPEHVSKVIKKIREADKGYSEDGLKRTIGAGLWSVIEKPHTQKAIRALGFDGFYVEEGGTKNLAVYEPSQVKSVFNIGDFSIDDRRLSFARSPIADMQEKALEKIDAVQSKEASNGYNLAKSPVTAKQGMNVVNQFMAQSPTFGKQVVDKILDMGLDNKKLLYNFLTLEQLADVGKDILPEMTTYYETFQEMAGYRDKQLFAANKIAKELSDLARAKPDQSELLADVAHSSTLASFDPDRPGTDRNPAITQMWNKLDPQAKALYRKMRDFYENRYNAYYALLLQRIDSAITDKNKKAEINARLKKQFETARVKGPYFPLARFGQYWVSYNDGVERFVMFENRSEAEKFKQSISHLKDVKAGLREERNLNMPIPNSVIKELIDTVDSAKNPTELKQDLWAAYLTMLPEVSMRKHFIPRKGTPGYSNDIVRVFAENTFHGAYNLARLKYAPQFEKSMDQMRERISEANKKGEGAEPQELFNALLKRQEFILNPTPSSMFSNAAGILGFTWFLTAPASAITNLSQNATVAYPILGARFGFGKAMNEMLGASRLFMSSGERNLDEPFSMVRALEQRVKESSGADKKRYERELKAIEALMDNGTLSRTQTMDLAQLTDKPSIVGTKLNTFMKWTAAMFHGAEVFNRSTTAYAAYRMAFDKSGDHEAAIKEASRLVRRSHFDYSASNKAPIAQGEYAKVIFMFKQYGMNMTYLLLREAQILGKHVIKRYKGTPLEQEAIDRAREARDTLVGIMGMTGLFSGVMGLPYPMYLMTMLVANALFGDEEDEVFDAETRFKLWLTDSLGASAADIIAKGPVSYLTGADFSERVSMNGLIFREVGRLGAKQAEEQEQKEATLQWIADITGPLGGLAINFSKGLGAMSNGNVYQGIEMMIPLAVANGMKGFRYYTEGVLTMKGDPIVEEVNTYQSFLRAIGYAPTEVARQLEENTAIRAVESQATMSRKRLLNRFALAIHENDYDAIEDIEAAIERFNEKYPGYEITGQTLTQSLRARDAASAETEHGLRINKRIRGVYERASRLNEE